MSEIRIAVDESLPGILGDSPEEVERQALEMIVLGMYRLRKISAGRAAMFLDMDKLAFIRRSGSLGIPYLDLTADELAEERKVFERSRSTS